MGLSKFEKAAHDITGLRAWRFKGESESPAVRSLRTEYKENARVRFVLKGLDGKLTRKKKESIFNQIFAPFFNSALMQKIRNAYQNTQQGRKK